jgi:hypothetical protein
MRKALINPDFSQIATTAGRVFPTGLDMIGSSPIRGQLGEPEQYYERRVWPTPLTTERQNQRFNRRVRMAVERTQINLTNLLAGWANESQPRIYRGSHPQVEP